MLHYSFRSKEHHETLLTIFWRFFMTRTNECKISRSPKEHQREPKGKLKTSSDSCCRNESNPGTTSVQLCQAFDFIKPWRLKAVFYAVKMAPRNIYRLNPHLVIYWSAKQVLNLFDNGIIKIIVRSKKSDARYVSDCSLGTISHASYKIIIFSKILR